MIRKFESQCKSSPDDTNHRVKGLAFHPTRPWILVSMHRGEIQLWDYRMEMRIASFNDHVGPVRSVDFHPQQPLFASGGDDGVVKVWNYETGEKLFDLMEHVDFVRRVQFHHEQPWLLSASDDHTVRIWNWQSRESVCVLSGHAGYVMCATFHPTLDLVATASLDKTIRIWNISGLRKRVGTSTSLPDIEQDRFAGFGGAAGFDQGGGEWGAPDFYTMHELEGHVRGVNWVAFHPTRPLLASGADDHEVRVWRFTDAQYTCVHTLRGHSHNVSCVMWHPRDPEVLLSNSEDRSLRVWHLQRRHAPKVFRRAEGQRYWILAAHPTLRLLAAGHDEGLMLFKLRRERPAFCSAGAAQVAFVSEDGAVHVRRVVSASAGDRVVARASTALDGLSVDALSSAAHFGGAARAPMLLMRKPGDDKDAQPGKYELLCGEKTQRGTAIDVAFVATNRFVCLVPSAANPGQTELCVRDARSNELKRRIGVPAQTVATGLFAAPVPAHVLLRVSDGLALFDLTQKRVAASLKTQSRTAVQRVVWNESRTLAAVQTTFTVHIIDNTLRLLCSVHESVRIKSACWTPSDVLLFGTHMHVKYAVLSPLEHGADATAFSAEVGVLRALESPMYVAAFDAKHSRLVCLDREQEVQCLAVETSEFLFKAALARKDVDALLRVLQRGRLVGEHVVAHLHRKGFSEVALRFVDDPVSKFELALACKDGGAAAVGVAEECAQQLQQSVEKGDERVVTKRRMRQIWQALARRATQLGQVAVAERALQQLRRVESLGLLYAVAGLRDRQRRLLEVAATPTQRFEQSLFLGDAAARVQALRQAQRRPLAWLTARSHGLSELAAELETEMAADLPRGQAELEMCRRYASQETCSSFTPPVPTQRVLPLSQVFPGQEELAWPQSTSHKTILERIAQQGQQVQQQQVHHFDEDEVEEEFSPEEDDVSPSEGGLDLENVGVDEDMLDGDLDLDLGLDEDDLGLGLDRAEGHTETHVRADAVFVMPVAAPAATDVWLENARCVGDVVAAGAFDVALGMLRRSVALRDARPLRALFADVAAAAHAEMPMNPDASSGGVVVPLRQGAHAQLAGLSLRECVAQFGAARRRLQQAVQKADSALSQQVLQALRRVLHTLPLLPLRSAEELQSAQRLLQLARDHVGVARLCRRYAETDDAALAADTVLLLALFAVGSNGRISAPLCFLALRRALELQFKRKNLATTAQVARRLLELSVSASLPDSMTRILPQIRKVLQRCEQPGASDASAPPFDVHKCVSAPQLRLCHRSLKPLLSSADVVTCPYTGATYLRDYAGSTCDVCLISEIGAEATGLSLAR